MTPEREAEAELMVCADYSTKEILEELNALPGPKLSRATFYVWRVKNALARKERLIAKVKALA
jgi:hypothetical protein